MKVFGQLEKAQLENVTADPASGTPGQAVLNTTQNRIKVDDGSAIVEVTTNTQAQVLTNKDIDGGVATNARRLTLPKETEANLTALTRKEATLTFSTDTDTPLVDDGVNLRKILTDTNVSVVQNKDIDGGTASNTSRLTVPKAVKTTLDGLTRKEGSLLFATDEGTLYQDNGVDLLPVGSGGGGLSTWIAENYNALAPASLSRGNNATFNSGGTFNGTLSLETVAPISGTKSLRYVQGASSLNDWFDITKRTSVELKAKGKTNVLTFLAQYSGNDNDLEVIVFDLTNGVELASTLIKSTTANRLYEISFTVPTTCNSLVVGVQTLVLNNTKILIIDDIQVDYNKIVSAQVSNDSDWVNAGTITLASTGTAPTKGTIDVDILRYRFDGSDCIAQYIFRQTSGGTAGTGQVIYPTPAGVEITDDIPNYTTVVTNLLQTPDAVRSYIPSSGVVTTGGTSDGDVRAYKYSSTQFRIMLTDFFATGEVHSSSYYAYTGANLSYNFEIRFRVKNRPAFNQAFISNATLGANWTNLNQAMVIGAVTTAPIKPSGVTVDTIYYVTHGSMRRFRYEYKQTNITGATAGSGDYLYSLPVVNGVQQRFAASVRKTTAAIASTDSLDSTLVWGNGLVREGGGASGGVVILPYNDTQFRVLFGNFFTQWNPQAPIWYGLNSNANQEWTFDFEIPIDGLTVENSVTVLSPQIRVAKFIHSLAAGSDGGTFTSGSWQTRPLNVQLSGFDFSSLNGSNQVTLEAGAYICHARAQAFRVNDNRLRLANASGGAEIVRGMNSFAPNDNTNGDASDASLHGFFEIAVPTVVELRHQCSLTRATDGFGFTQGTGFGENEVFAELIFYKLR